MSLYFVQKLFYHLNVDPDVKRRFQTDPDGLLARYRLAEAEIRAIKSVDIATLYKMGVHALLLRPFATFNRVNNQEYARALAEPKEVKP